MFIIVCLQLQYGDSVTKRSVPLALALLSASNPQLPVIDTLSKLSHDIDAETAHNAILAMGIVGGLTQRGGQGLDGTDLFLTESPVSASSIQTMINE